jgi:hypothetical protein
MCALVASIARIVDMAARYSPLGGGRQGISPTGFVVALSVALTVLSGCAKGQPILETDIIRLDPTRPMPLVDASAESGSPPPAEMSPTPSSDAGATPPTEMSPTPDSGASPAERDSGVDATAPDGG